MAERKPSRSKASRPSAGMGLGADYDGPWKEALDRYFQAFLAFFFPHAHADINRSRGYEMLDKELQKIVPQSKVG